ncbi:hypothetical protein V498_05845 [Pseudogymnoascus sp. VKM F-4517 (FW-2822)]|nr:hypothetical protein V498_05845 [Pseudogymnoascus sp. VKM F-4517 (FW-2822)]
MDAPDIRPKARAISVIRHRHYDFDVIRRAAALELRLGLEEVLDARAAVVLDHALDPNQRLDLRVEPVRHELELAVGRDEGDGAVVLEAREPHALVELDVFHLDGLAACGAPGRLEHHLVVEPEAQLGHAGEVALHLDGAENLGAQHVASRGDEEVEGFDDVEEDFVFPVADAFGAP